MSVASTWADPKSDPMADMRSWMAAYTKAAVDEHRRELEALFAQAIALQDPWKLPRLHQVVYGPVDDRRYGVASMLLHAELHALEAERGREIRAWLNLDEP